jgi:hypothetical protein
MVIPFSRSRSISSNTWSIISLSLIVLVDCKRRSARVDLPWSMCAIMQKFLVFFNIPVFVAAKVVKSGGS